MTTLPNPTVDQIYSLYQLNAEKDEQRKYLGGSIIGQECDRRIWYSFRHAMREKFDGRILRLFESGNLEEKRLIENLKSIGLTVLDKDPTTGEQWRYDAIAGHFSCGLDGVAIGFLEAPETYHLLEIKTANEKRFNEFEKHGVEKTSQEYWAQVQVYMGLAELDRCAFFVVCKNDDRIYFERIKFDKKVFDDLMRKAKRIINAENSPDRISDDPSFFKCKFCPFLDLCHGNKMPQVNCRTCVHSSPSLDKKWACGRGEEMDKTVSGERDGCEEHMFAPSLLQWAEPIDGDRDYIKYNIKNNGVEFVNCTATSFPAQDVPHYSSRELSKTVVENIGNKAIESARHILGGEIVETKDLRK